MSEDDYNPYTALGRIVKLYNEIYNEWLSWEYHDINMETCREVLNEIEQKHRELKEWIKKKEELNKKAEGNDEKEIKKNV